MKVGRAHTIKQKTKPNQEAQTTGESERHTQGTRALGSQKKHYLKAHARGLNQKCEAETQLRDTSRIHKQDARANGINKAENRGILHSQASAGGTCGDPPGNFCLSLSLSLSISGFPWVSLAGLRLHGFHLVFLGFPTMHRLYGFP